MASPFAVFRRNQKIMLAVVGIGAMVAFVFLGPLMQYMGSAKPGVSKNPVVVETKYGNLTQSELESLRFQREIVDRFLQLATQQAIVRQVGQTNLDSRWLSSLVEQRYRMWRQELMGRSSQGPEGAAVETMILAERARQMGLVVTDQSINDLIKQVTADSVSAEELQQIVRKLQPARPIGIQRLFDALRTEVLASQYMQLFVQSLRDIPPAERYEYFCRLNRRAKAEVMSLAVADFVGQVADPTDAEVKEYYEKYKNDFPNPASPEPGFKEPKRASFQYFKGNLDQLTDQIKPEITDEEIAKYYEENKRNFPAVSFQDEPLEESAAEKAPGADEAKSSEEKPAEEAAPAEGEPDKKPAEPAAEKPAEEKPAAEKPAETPASEAPAEEKPAEEKATEEKPADESIDGDEAPAPQASRGGLGLSAWSARRPQQPARSRPPKARRPANLPHRPSRPRRRTRRSLKGSRILRQANRRRNLRRSRSPRRRPTNLPTLSPRSRPRLPRINRPKRRPVNPSRAKRRPRGMHPPSLPRWRRSPIRFAIRWLGNGPRRS